MVWYGMVWCGGAEQIPAFACFNIHVDKNKILKRKEKVEIMTLLSVGARKGLGMVKQGLKATKNAPCKRLIPSNENPFNYNFRTDCKYAFQKGSPEEKAYNSFMEMRRFLVDTKTPSKVAQKAVNFVKNLLG